MTKKCKWGFIFYSLTRNFITTQIQPNILNFTYNNSFFWTENVNIDALTWTCMWTVCVLCYKYYCYNDNRAFCCNFVHITIINKLRSNEYETKCANISTAASFSKHTNHSYNISLSLFLLSDMSIWNEKKKKASWQTASSTLEAKLVLKSECKHVARSRPIEPPPSASVRIRAERVIVLISDA